MKESVFQIQQLAATFPCLVGAPEIVSWQPLKLDEWAASGKPSHGEIVSARFLLAVWNPDEAWQSGRFDLMEALSVWDTNHHQAFLEWAREPWWA